MGLRGMQPHTSYFICATPRSGSTLLSEALARTGLAGRPNEFFCHPRGYGASYEGWDISDYRTYIRRVIEATMTPNGVFGAKMMGGFVWDFVSRVRQIPEFAAQPGMPLKAMLDELFPNLHHIWVTRRNKVRQAVSWWMSTQTNQWTSVEVVRAEREPVYDFAAIDHNVQEIVMREAALQAYFDEIGVKPFVVVYEDYHDEPEETALAVLRYLDIPLPPTVQFAERRLRKQANELSEAWVQRYRDEKQQAWLRRIW